MARNVIREQWESYRSTVLPSDAPPIQVQECRRAFVSGAAALFGAIVTMLEPGAEPTEADLVMMDDIHRELGVLVAEELLHG